MAYVVATSDSTRTRCNPGSTRLACVHMVGQTPYEEIASVVLFYLEAWKQASFLFFYELSFDRPPGLLGGPGVPYIGSQTMSSVRRTIDRLMTWNRK